MSFADTPLIVNTTTEQQAEIEAHWERVRAGLHKPQEHDFSEAETDVSHLASMHRAIAMTCIRGGAKHALRAIELSVVEP